MKKLNLLFVTTLTATSFLMSCKSAKVIDTSINTQTQRVESVLKRSDYTLLDKTATYTVKNKKKFRKYNLNQLKDAAFMSAENEMIKSGADGILNPKYIVKQKGKKLTVTVHAKAYRLKNDNEYLNMENSLKHNPNK